MPFKDFEVNIMSNFSTRRRRSWQTPVPYGDISSGTRYICYTVICHPIATLRFRFLGKISMSLEPAASHREPRDSRGVRNTLLRPGQHHRGQLRAVHQAWHHQLRVSQPVQELCPTRQVGSYALCIIFWEFLYCKFSMKFKTIIIIKLGSIAQGGVWESQGPGLWILDLAEQQEASSQWLVI